MKRTKWTFYFLICAGLYNISWSIFIFINAQGFWNILYPEASTFPIWVYFLAALVGFLGVLYVWAASNPFKFYGAIVLGVLTKTLGPFISFWVFNTKGIVIINLLGLSFINDVLWILPFALILRMIIQQKN